MHFGEKHNFFLLVYKETPQGSFNQPTITLVPTVIIILRKFENISRIATMLSRLTSLAKAIATFSHAYKWFMLSEYKTYPCQRLHFPGFSSPGCNVHPLSVVCLCQEQTGRKGNEHCSPKSNDSHFQVDTFDNYVKIPCTHLLYKCKWVTDYTQTLQRIKRIITQAS